MYARFSAGFVALSILCLSHVSANPVSLFIPGAEGDEPFTADVLGTDSTGHTTWRIGIGSASGSFTATDGAGAYPSVTLVEGSSDIHIIQAIPTSGATDSNLPTQAEQDCVYSTVGAQAGSAVCTIRLEAADETTTMVQTISGNVVEVQVAATVTGGGGGGGSSQSTPTATDSGSAGSLTQTTSGGSVGATGTSSSGTAAATQTQSGQGNGAGKTGFVGISALVFVTLVNLLLL